MKQSMEGLGRNRTPLICRWMTVVFLALIVFVFMPSSLRAQDTLIYQFQGGAGSAADGAYPNGGLIADSSGNLYGTAVYGGNYTGNCLIVVLPVGCGIVYELKPTGGLTYAYSVLYRFSGTNGTGDGANPRGALIFDSYGNLYGTTSDGGSAGCGSPSGCGTAFVLCENPASPLPNVCNSQVANTEIVLARMNPVPNYGRHPYGPLVMDKYGNLYGTNFDGANFTNCGSSGDAGCGDVFVVCAPGAAAGDPAPCVASAAAWAYNEIYLFSGAIPDGANPYDGLIIDSTGNLYGTTASGGTNNATKEPCGKWPEKVLVLGCGTVFELKPSGGAIWNETVLYSFAGYPNDGSYPLGTPIWDNAAVPSLYGTTESGPAGGGTVYQFCFAIASPGCSAGLGEHILFKFNDRWDGGNAFAGVTFDSTYRLLSGATYSGGGGHLGAVFELKKNGGGVWKEGSPAVPFASQALWSFESYGAFQGQCLPALNGIDGCNPYGGVLYVPVTIHGGAHNYLFGTTYVGGNQGFGTVYAVATK